MVVRATFWLWFVVLPALIVGCSTAPPLSRSHFGTEYFPSRNSELRFRIPEGWLNATNDSSSATAIIWLIRNDYEATISVRDVGIDGETRREITRSGLKRIADLTLALVANERGVSVTDLPRTEVLGSETTCRYSYTTGGSNDRVRVILLDTGSKVYEVSLLQTGKSGDSVEIQNAFVQNLRW